MVHHALRCVFLMTIWSCQSPLTERDYIDWVEDTRNGLRVVEVREPWVFDIQFKPREYDRLKGGNELTHDEYNTEMAFFELQIKSTASGADWLTDGLTHAERQQRMYFFSYLFEQHIFLEVDHVRIPCHAFHFERAAYPGLPQRFHVGFEIGIEQKKTYTLIVDSDFFSTFLLRFRFLPKRLPRLKGK